jgi:hypothetical protein
MPRRAEKTKSGSAVHGKRYPLNMRTTFELRRELEAAANASGRSLAQEAELRIERSFRDQRFIFEILEAVYGRGAAGILSVIGHVMKIAGRNVGFAATQTLEGAEHWWNDPYAYDQVVRGINRILREAAPDGKIELPAAARIKGGPPDLNFEAQYENMGEGFALGILNDIVSERPISAGNEEIAIQARRLLGDDLVKRLKAKGGKRDRPHSTAR